MLSCWRTTVLASFLCVASVRIGVSQTPKRYLRGTVADSLGNLIAYATVQINADARVTTDHNGAFRLESPDHGRFLLTVRRLGYKAAAPVHPP